MRIQCECCLRAATHEYEGRDYCWNCEPLEEDDEEGGDVYKCLQILN